MDGLSGKRPLYDPSPALELDAMLEGLERDRLLLLRANFDRGVAAAAASVQCLASSVALLVLDDLRNGGSLAVADEGAEGVAPGVQCACHPAKWLSSEWSP